MCAWPRERRLPAMTAITDLKQIHRATWAAGDYATVAEQIDDAPPRDLLAHMDIAPGAEVLDVATGTGNVALKAARAGAQVVGLDLTPELFTTARRRAEQLAVSVDWVEGDAEDLPYEDECFDRVLSVFGVQFAPRHAVVARELDRVCRPGGRIGLVNWTPAGLIGELFKIMGRYMPPPPAFASPPPLWGDEQHVRDLFGDRVVDLEMRRQTVVMDVSPDPVSFREYWKRTYGPAIAVYAHNAADPERVAAMDRDLLQLLTAWNTATTPGRTAYSAEYLLVTARKR